MMNGEMDKNNEMKSDLEEALLNDSPTTGGSPTEEDKPSLERFFSAPVGSMLHLSQGSSMRGTILSLINTVTGAGILGKVKSLSFLSA